MATNNFKVFDELGQNMMTDADYGSDIQRQQGVAPGLAEVALHNKLYRQVSVMAAAIGQLLAARGQDATDGDVGALVGALDKGLGPAGMSVASSTGPVATINAGGAWPLDYTARIVSTQSGSGDPSPTNVRPIAGKSSVSIYRYGDNLIPLDWPTHTNGGFQFVYADGTLKLTGVATSANPLMYLGGSAPNPIDKYNGLAGKLVWIGGASATTAVGLNVFRRSDGGWLRGALSARVGQLVSGVIPAIAADEYLAITIQVIGAAGTTLNGEVLRPLLAYQAASHTITLGQTVAGLPNYPATLSSGGTCNILCALLTLTGTENWSTYTTTTDGVRRPILPVSQQSYPVKPVTNNGTVAAIQSSHYIARSANVVHSQTQGVSVDVGGVISIYDPSYTSSDLTAWKAYLAAQYAAGKPVQLLYEIATPRTVTVQAPTIPALDGINNMWSDGGGDTTVSGYAGDAQLIQLLASMQAQIDEMRTVINELLR